MQRGEAVTAFAAALALVTAGVTWLFGPVGLIGAGVLLALVMLLIVDVRE